VSGVLSDDSGGIDVAWNSWRTRTLNSLLVVACVLALPFAIPWLLGDAGPQGGWRLSATGLYLLLLLNTLLYRQCFRVRSWVTVGIAYSVAILALANKGLVGFGRVGLAVYPFMVILLLGPRAGWAATGIGLGIYGGFATLSLLGCLQGWGIATGDPVAPATWVAQGLGLILAVVPSVVLVSRFRRHHVLLMEAEQGHRKQLQDEVSRRTAAYESLEREQAERRRLQDEILQLGEQERQHLGQEIHDGLCQQLTAIVLRCTALQEQLNSRQAAEAPQADRVGELIQEALDSAYAISKGVWPVGPESDDLLAALESLARRISSEFGLSCEFRHQGNIVVADGQVAMHLYRITQEAAMNAVKHASASRICLLVRRVPGEISLQVTDDGRCTAEPTTLGHGMGLSIMAYRAGAIGGTLTMERSEDGGTVVSCRVPLPGNECLEGDRLDT
jgi:signal transduction histidine kinase